MTLATVPVTGTHATLTTSSLSLRTHNLTALYSGDQNNLASVSASTAETILLSDFTLTSTPPALSIVTGHHLTFTITASSVGAMAGPVQLDHDVLPAHATLNLKQSNLHLSQGGQASTSVYLDTDDVMGYLSHNDSPGTGSSSSYLAGAAMLPLLALLTRRGRRRLPTLLTLVAAVWLLASVTACSGKYPASTPPGNYTLRVTATSTTGLTHILEIPLNVTQ